MQPETVQSPEVTLAQLESHLWGAANILRGSPVDRTDWNEYLIKTFADATKKKAGEFYTPRSVVRLMIEILD
ncbi:MAG: SAM-dependent DNA methyltransferase, partial [Lamprocystis purpurea]|nr:SAM-dependent DNA methyltransferase [Lamprocystis purpurea]